jgi:hypothetical protein
MPTQHRPPSYRLHKTRNCAVVTIDGRNRYLGKYGSPESYENLCSFNRGMEGWRLWRASDAQCDESRRFTSRG